MRFSKQGVACTAIAFAAILALAAPRLTGETSPVEGKVPQGVLDSILNEAAALANVAREQLVIVRAEPVVWNDGSLRLPGAGEYVHPSSG